MSLHGEDTFELEKGFEKLRCTAMQWDSKRENDKEKLFKKIYLSAKNRPRLFPLQMANFCQKKKKKATVARKPGQKRRTNRKQNEFKFGKILFH